MTTKHSDVDCWHYEGEISKDRERAEIVRNVVLLDMIVSGALTTGNSALLRMRHIGIAVALVATVVCMCIANPAFMSFENARDLIVQIAPTIVVGCGMTFVVMVGEIDISVGSLFGFLAAMMGLFSSPQRANLSAPVAVGFTLLMGAGFGLFNGILITVLRVPSIVATLGVLTIVRGATEMALGGAWITDLPPGIRAMGTDRIVGMPWCVWTAFVVFVAAAVIANGTALGIKIRAVGGNAHAAELGRVSARGVKVFAFVLLGLLTAVAVVVTVPQQSTIEAGIGSGFELVVVTAVVVGGTSIRGGVGGVGGTLLAAMLLGIIRTALVFLKLGEMATFWERAIQGAFILAAVLVDHIHHVRAAGGRR